VLSQGDRGITAKLESRDSIRLSETLVVTLSVEGGEGLQVDSPPVADSSEWRVERQTKGEMTRLENGRRHWRREIELDPKGPGKLPLPEIVVRYRSGPGQEWTPARLDARSVEVAGPEGTD